MIATAPKTEGTRVVIACTRCGHILELTYHKSWKYDVLDVLSEEELLFDLGSKVGLDNATYYADRFAKRAKREIFDVFDEYACIKDDKWYKELKEKQGVKKNESKERS